MEKTNVPWHWHEEVEFGCVITGEVAVSTTSQTFHFREGYFINTNILDTMKNIDKCVTDSHLFHATFLSAHFRSVFETKYVSPVLQNRKIELIELRGNTKNQQMILSKLRQVSELQKRIDTEFQKTILQINCRMVLFTDIFTINN